MATPKFTNNATTTVPARVAAEDTTIVLATATGGLFPTLGATEYFKATLQSTAGAVEIVKVTARSGDTCTVVRGQDGTLPTVFPANSRFELRVIASTIQDALDGVDFLLL